MDTRPRTSLISFCTVHLRTLCAAHSLVTLCLSMTSGPDPGELPGFWGSMVFRHAPIPRKGSGNQQQQQGIDWESSRLISQEVSDLWRVTSTSPVNISESFTFQEFAAVLKHLKPGKAPGPNSICPELITHAGAALKSWLGVNQCFSDPLQ